MVEVEERPWALNSPMSTVQAPWPRLHQDPHLKRKEKKKKTPDLDFLLLKHIFLSGRNEESTEPLLECGDRRRRHLREERHRWLCSGVRKMEADTPGEAGMLKRAGWGGGKSGSLCQLSHRLTVCHSR